MIEFIWDESFKRKYKKLTHYDSNFKSIFWKKFKKFSENPNAPTFKTHKLSGKLSNCYSATFEYDCRIIFQYIDSNTILLIDIGSHDEV